MEREGYGGIGALIGILAAGAAIAYFTISYKGANTYERLRGKINKVEIQQVENIRGNLKDLGDILEDGR